MRFAVSTRCLNQPLRVALASVANLGAEGVQFDLRDELPAADLSQTGLREVRKLLDDGRLAVGSTVFPTRRDLGDANQLDARLAAISRAMTASYQLGARVLVYPVADCPVADQADFGRWIESLTMLSTHSQRAGALLALQVPGGVVEPWRALLDAHRLDGIGFDVHPLGLLLAGSPAEFTTRMGNRVLHAHACDGIPTSGRSSVQPVELGRGLADMPAVLAALDGIGYQGWVTIEARGSGDPVRACADALAFVRAV